MAVWRTPAPRPDNALLAQLKSDHDVAKLLSPEILDGCFDDAYHLAQVDLVFDRVFVPE
jgi:adenylosuccinate lyase